MNDLYIMHYGVGHDKGGHSGRYPWGSGENPYGGKRKFEGINGNLNRTKFSSKVSALKGSEKLETAYHENQISSFFDGNMRMKGQPAEKYIKKYGSIENFMTNRSSQAEKDRRDYYKKILDLDWEMQIDIDELKMIRDEWREKGKKLIESYGKVFDLNSLYDESHTPTRNIAQKELNKNIRSFIDRCYDDSLYQDDIDIISDIMFKKYSNIDFG